MPDVRSKRGRQLPQSGPLSGVADVPYTIVPRSRQLDVPIVRFHSFHFANLKGTSYPLEQVPSLARSKSFWNHFLYVHSARQDFSQVTIRHVDMGKTFGPVWVDCRKIQL